MSRKLSKRLLRLATVLFLLEIITFPIVVKLTYSGRSEGPDRILTYRPGKLTWDTNKKILSDGTAVLSLFDTDDKNVHSENEDNLIAPGMERSSIVRLKNEAGYPIDYTAVCYEIKSHDELDMQVTLDGIGFADSKEKPDLKSIPSDKIIRSVEGTLPSGQIQDFDILFHWIFDENNPQNRVDTILGNNSANGDAANVKVGIYIFVNDSRYGGSLGPGTGDNTPFVLYIILIIASSLFLIFMLIERRRSEEKEEHEEVL